MINPNAGVLDIQPYKPGKGTDNSRGYKLSSNETPLGPSVKSIEAFKNTASSLYLYPDGSAGKLREAISFTYNIDPSRIVCGAGSDEILSLLAQSYLSEGDEAVYTKHGFLVYDIIIKANGAKAIIADEVDYKANVNNILSCITNKTKAIFLANPNNPTGTYLSEDEIRRLASGIGENILLVLDAAYAEYVTNSDYEAGISIVNDYQNVVMTRTFSKIYGLAALRLGWAYCSDVVAGVLNRVRGPFNVSSQAISAGVAAIMDQDHVKKSIEHNDYWKEWLTNELTRFGLKVTDSVGNFILIHFPNNKDQKDANSAYNFLLERNIVLRKVGAYSLPNALRMTIGSDAANKLVARSLQKFMS